MVRSPLPVGRRGVVLLGITLAGVWAIASLGIGPKDVVPHPGGLETLGRFFAHAFAPALDYEADFKPDTPLLLATLKAAHLTVVYAAAAMSIAFVLALPLGFLASQSWWRGRVTGGPGKTLLIGVWIVTRGLIAFMRSIHELLWAVLALAAMGLTDLSAVFAIAIPFTGFLAKVFSEVLDEAPEDTALALRALGATEVKVFVFGLVPRALPDMASYAFYRFECALRSSAVIGFFGPQTLGKYIKEAWYESHYGEVWTYLYALFALVILMEWWSGALRRRVIPA